SVAFEPLLVAEPVRDALELLPGEVRSPGAAQRRPLFALVEDVYQQDVEDRRLDAVKRGIAPLDRAIFALRIARQKRFAGLAEILEDCPGLEDPDLAVIEARHLVERLLEQIFRRP